jgi:hypothetical protein
MTTYGLIAQKIWTGYAKAAQRLGPIFTIYRPNSATQPLQPSSVIATLPASFSVDPKFVRPQDYGNARWTCLVDGNITRPGDYLSGSEGTWFIAQQHIMLPISAVLCNRTADLHRAAQQTGTGINGYGGNTYATEQILLQGWPMSILKAPYGAPTELKLPGDTVEPKWNILVPLLNPVFGVTFQTRDIVEDDLSRRFFVELAELTELGWRVSARQVMT